MRCTQPFRNGAIARDYEFLRRFWTPSGLRENDRVELVQVENGIHIQKIVQPQHRTLEERLTAFYGKPIEEIETIESEEMDWGKAEGQEVW